MASDSSSSDGYGYDVPPHVYHPVSLIRWVEFSVQRWNWLVPKILVIAAAVIFVIVLILTWFARWRGRKRRAVPFYWENVGRDLKHGDNKYHQDYFDDSFPLTLEQRIALQELMNHTSTSEGDAFRLIRAKRIESSNLWLRYRRRLRELRKAHAPCEFQGEGEPRIRQAVGELDNPDLSAFGGRDMVSDACEAFLWMGTRPETAMKVIMDGEQLESTETAGRAARFGVGWYFSEDVSVAHKKAGTGQHLYKDCYAMLLCRVILGRQQLVHDIAEDRTPATTETDGGAFDHSPTESSVGHKRSDDGSDADTPPSHSGGLRSRVGRRPSWRHRTGVMHLRSLARERPGSAEEYDSTVAESAGNPREFVVYDSAQVYPEYALVYEHVAPEHLEYGVDGPSYWEHARSVLFGSIYPPYWKHCRPGAGTDFHDMFPAMKFKSVLQELATETWKHKWTRDRAGANGHPIPKGDPYGEMPAGIQVLQAWRVENGEMWSHYRQTLQAVTSARSSCTDLKIKTTGALKWNVRRRLRTDINEAYLWHGTSPRAVLGIATEGFNIDLVGTNVGAMFGRGAYMAECSSKADEYSRDDKDGYFAGCFAMLLCRVVLGESQVLQQADHHAHERVGSGFGCDSTCGDRESAVGTYREFIVPKATAIYPEYAIIYERIRPSKSGRVRAHSASR